MEDKIGWTPKTADKCAVKFFEKRTHTQEEISEVLSALEFWLMKRNLKTQP